MKKLFALSTLLIATSTFAGFQPTSSPNTGFSAKQSQVMTVAQALKATDNSLVVLKGNVIQQLSKDDFLFKDNTGQIKIEIENDVLATLQFTDKDTVIIEGKVDNDIGESTTIDVFRITKP